jgi:DNA-binding GntR family transcriptional regulator
MSAEKHLTLRERIRDELVRMIVSGELPAGAAIDEKKLVERLSTSRTPFREAIGTLEREGLIEIRPYRGFFVRQLSRKDVEDLYDLRETLEAMAARRAVERASDGDIDRLSAMLDRAVQALRADDMAAYAAEDRRFHEFIAELSDNHALVDTLSRLALQIQMCRVIANRSRDFAERAADERDRILGAFRQRDAELAARLMAEHIADVRQSVMAQLMAEAG